MINARSILNPDGGGHVVIADDLRPIVAPTASDSTDRAVVLDRGREQIINYVKAAARDNEDTIALDADDPSGRFTVYITPDGAITADPPPTPEPLPISRLTPLHDHHHSPDKPTHRDTTNDNQEPTMTTTPTPARPAPPTPAPSPFADPTPPRLGPPARPHPAAPSDPPATSADHAPGRDRALRATMLTEPTAHERAKRGLRGRLNRLGLTLPPTASELADRADTATACQHWPGPRTIAVVNGKGGSGKTPTTVLISAVLARMGGGGIIAVDNNITRGTLGWRTITGPHTATIADLVANLDRLTSSSAAAADLAAYVHHQPADRYDVLRSRPEVLATEQHSDAATIGAVLQLLSRTYRVTIIDSGNDESTPAWREMIHRADAIVVPTTTREEHAESARLLLAELATHDPHTAQLAEQATVIVSRASKGEPDPHHLVERFKTMTRSAVAIPYDPAMASRPLLWDNLAPNTRRAWLTATARAVEPFNTHH
ncbi:MULTISPECIES: AAA family ATPase [Actinomyces]|uniref:ATPase n=1 Tax=Actinomyces marmotae TaxID=2737173 RepID=A0A6M8B120_9ACTO|nr:MULTISPECIES: AAA family ATPase [Actinomyces]QKD79442.1 hypothetical protein HPC72_03515 [Actinomyces marmotae]